MRPVAPDANTFRPRPIGPWHCRLKRRNWDLSRQQIPLRRPSAIRLAWIIGLASSRSVATSCSHMPSRHRVTRGPFGRAMRSSSIAGGWRSFEANSRLVTVSEFHAGSFQRALNLHDRLGQTARLPVFKSRNRHRRYFGQFSQLTDA